MLNSEPAFLISPSANKDDAHETTKEGDHFFSSSWKNNVKIGILFIVWLFCTGVLVQGEEKTIKYKLITIPEQGVKCNVELERVMSYLTTIFPSFRRTDFTIPEESFGSLLSLSVEGPLLSEKENLTTLNYLDVSIETTVQQLNRSVADKTSTIWKIPVSSRTAFDTIIPTIRRNVFDVSMLSSDKLQSDDKHGLRIKFQTNSVEEFAIQLGYDMSPININVGVIFGGAILILFYGLIIFEVMQTNVDVILGLC